MDNLQRLNTIFQAELVKVKAEYSNSDMATLVLLMRATDTVKIVDALEVIAKRRALAIYNEGN